MASDSSVAKAFNVNFLKKQRLQPSQKSISKARSNLFLRISTFRISLPFLLSLALGCLPGVFPESPPFYLFTSGCTSYQKAHWEQRFLQSTATPLSLM